MAPHLEPLKNTSLKEACIQQLESLILTDQWKAGERLPSERDLAAQLGVSRPLLHQALVDLDAKGLVRIEPRRGVYICDFRVDGSIPILTSLMSFQGGTYQPQVFTSLIEARKLIEVETAQLAADNRTEQDLAELDRILDAGRNLSSEDWTSLVKYDFSLHQRVAIASGNLLYPLMINSLKRAHTNLAGEFYRSGAKNSVSADTIAAHAQLVNAIRQNNSPAAGSIMEDLLEKGEIALRQILSNENPDGSAIARSSSWNK